MLYVQFRDVGNTEFISHHYKNSLLGSLVAPIVSAVGNIFGGHLS